jgi:cell division protein FtsL
MPRRLVLMMAMVLVASMAVVQVRHESRLRFAELQGHQAERDALNTEWGKLLLEEGAWSQHRRVEAMAHSRLGMSTPEPAHVSVIHARVEATQ